MAKNYLYCIRNWYSQVFCKLNSEKQGLVIRDKQKAFRIQGYLLDTGNRLFILESRHEIGFNKTTLQIALTPEALLTMIEISCQLEEHKEDENYICQTGELG